jgi:hypothetical protein
MSVMTHDPVPYDMTQARTLLTGSVLPVGHAQDYLQVLSMFAGFGFDWPPSIKAIFNAFSLLNFNFELLAPECSVSLNFETKWCGACHLRQLTHKSRVVRCCFKFSTPSCLFACHAGTSSSPCR